MKPLALSSSELFQSPIGTRLPVSVGPEFDIWNGSSTWVQAAKLWFNGRPLLLEEKPGINIDDAIRHIRSVLSSYQPSHERKISGVAYLMSIWFESWEEVREESAQETT